MARPSIPSQKLHYRFVRAWLPPCRNPGQKKPGFLSLTGRSDAKPSTASSKFHDQLVPASPPSAAVPRRFPAFTRDENPGVADSPVSRTHVRQPPRGPGDSVLVVHEAGAARHGQTGGIVPPVISAVLGGTSTPHVPPTSPPAALLSIAHYGDTISGSGAVSSAGNAGGDTGAAPEAVIVMCSCQ